MTSERPTTITISRTSAENPPRRGLSTWPHRRRGGTVFSATSTPCRRRAGPAMVIVRHHRNRAATHRRALPAARCGSPGAMPRPPPCPGPNGPPDTAAAGRPRWSLGVQRVLAVVAEQPQPAAGTTTSKPGPDRRERGTARPASAPSTVTRTLGVTAGDPLPGKPTMRLTTVEIVLRSGPRPGTADVHDDDVAPAKVVEPDPDGQRPVTRLQVGVTSRRW